MRAEAKTVDEYIRQFPPDVQTALKNIRRTIRSAAPDAEERIGWGMPGYKHCGWLVFFAAFKHHCSFFPASKSVVESLRPKLKAFESGGGTIHFTAEHPLPAALVKHIVKMRIKENELRAERRKKRPA
jgi:uncharacterized protein YdhG (YjbR/CyaY superfamily)